MDAPLQLHLSTLALQQLRARVIKGRDTELLRRSDDDLALLLSACNIAIEGVAEEFDGLRKARRRLENFVLDEIDSGPLDLVGVARVADALGLEWVLRDRGTRLVIENGPWDVDTVACGVSSDGVEVLVARYESSSCHPPSFIQRIDRQTWTEAQHVIDGFSGLMDAG